MDRCKRGFEVVRRCTRDNPGAPIGNENFAQLLKEAFRLFYKPLTVIPIFRSSGIYPIDATVVTSTILKPGLTFLEEADVSERGMATLQETVIEKKQDVSDSIGALTALESVLDTPVRSKYKKRIEEDYDMEGVSPCCQVYEKFNLQ